MLPIPLHDSLVDILHPLLLETSDLCVGRSNAAQAYDVSATAAT